MLGPLCLLLALASPAPAPTPFPLLPGAEDLRATVQGEEREWSFTLQRPYPAGDVVEHYARHAARAGWVQCALAVRPWEPQRTLDPARTHFLHARIWGDHREHRTVMVVLRYVEPGASAGPTPGSDRLHVDVIVVPVSASLDPCDVPPAEGQDALSG